MAALIAPHFLDDVASSEGIDTVHTFIDARRDVIQDAVNQPPERFEYEKPKFCIDPVGSVNATFTTEWNTMLADPFTFAADLVGHLNGVPLLDSYVGAQAGIGEDGGSYIVVLGVDAAFENLSYVALVIPEDLGPGIHPVDIAAVPGFVLHLDLTDPLAVPDETVFIGGELVLTEMSYESGGAIVGEINGILLPNFLE